MLLLHFLPLCLSILTFTSCATVTQSPQEGGSHNEGVVKIESNDNYTVSLPRKVAVCSSLIKNMLEDLSEAEETTTIPILTISREILEKAFEYCEHHLEDLNTEITTESEFSEWDKRFFGIEQSKLFELILAANFLDIKSLLDAGCKVVADQIKGKSVEEIRVHFIIVNDFTPEEEEKIRRENELLEA